jgi:signal transduction histidine kinase
MLHEFLVANRGKLIERCRVKVAARRAPRATPEELEYGVPLFLTQLTEMLPHGSLEPGHAKAEQEDRMLRDARLASDATKHGGELMRHDFTIDQVVHDYGDLCQSITEVAMEDRVPITVREFGTLNIKLDNAIAGAVTEFARQRELKSTNEGASATNERLGVLAHEMRNHLNTAILAASAIKSGSVGLAGATAKALDHSLIGMRALIDRTLAEVRLENASETTHEVIEVAPFILEVQVAAALEASSRGCDLTVTPVEPGIFIQGDRHILAAAVANLLQNAFKFTRPTSHVLLRAYAAKGRVLIEVEDECGGLPAEVEQLFHPFAQHCDDRSGLGLGLTISRQAVEACGGKLYARDIAGTGCVFTIDLPRK